MYKSNAKFSAIFSYSLAFYPYRAMRILLSVLFLVSASTAIPVDNTKIVTALKSTATRISAHGYPAEEHTVETTDGYVVKMFRIPYSHKLQNKNTVRPAVFIQHGLFSCSDAWVAVGPDSGLPYLLADLGYDVWMGNARGNTYSKNNTKLSVKHPKFWRFSWHEIGIYDISAMIDYILLETQQESLHYVGHSQGTSVFFVLMSMKPEYNEKIKTAHMLAPIGYMNHMTDILVNTLAPYLGVNGIYSALFGSAEFLPRNDIFTLLGYNACGEDIQFPKFCSQFAMVYDGNNTNTNKTALPFIAETHPAGASTDQILHYMQEFNSGHFRQFDFGYNINLKEYNQPYPPDYEIENIFAEVHFYYSDNDNMAAVEDVLKLAERLPYLKSMNHVADPTWSHTDFSMAYEVKAVINDRITSIMDEYEGRTYRK